MYIGTLMILSGAETLLDPAMCLKMLKTVAFRSSEPFYLGNGRVRVGRVYRLSDKPIKCVSYPVKKCLVNGIRQ